jgi:asparagine synthase (glutamine-hydrolysing)
MCGICGLVFADPERPIDKEMIRRMTEIMSHRGPDSQGFYVAPGIGLGITRLSIIDLQTGDQPISNEDGTITVICNGEIYNFQELRQALMAAGHRFRTRSDVEVIVHLYEDCGVKCVNHLRGMFGFALWDSRTRLLMLARDRLGIKPLCYALTSDLILFGSEYKSILISNGIERQIDYEAFKDLFTVGFILGRKTLFKNIRRLLPGHYLLYQDGRFSVHRYWDLHFPVSRQSTHTRTAHEWSESLRAKLEESVRIHLRSDVPVGAWLSGGIDSSAVVSLMNRLSDHPVRTFTLAFENKSYDEASTQRILTDFPGYDISNRQAHFTNNDFNLLPKAAWHCEDPSTLGIGIARMLLSQLASQDVKVVLTGEGSDEVFGGYPWFRVDKMLRPFRPLPLRIRRLLTTIPAIRKRWSRAVRILRAPPNMSLIRYKQVIDSTYPEHDPRLFSDDLRQRLIDHGDPEDDLSLPPDFDRYHPFSQLQYLEMKVRLSDFITRNLDLASMAYSLEVRVPFLDHEFVEFCSRIPPNFKMKWLEEKHILRRAMRDILPPEILMRRKRGLSVPYPQWIRDQPEFAGELLSADMLRKTGYFSPKYVTDMFKEHKSGKPDYGIQLLRVLDVQLWHHHFIEGCRPNQNSDLD